jgi:hypothetical protein
MKATYRILFLILFLGLPYISISQTFFCSAFSITNVYPDSLNPGDYQLSIQCIAGPNEFVSYPFVPSVLDCNGDTVATGGLFYFGQLGQTTQDYPVTLTGNGDINCYPLTASFVINYDPGFTDTCQLTYGASGLDQQLNNNQSIRVSPNPASNLITLSASQNFIGKAYAICDALGKPVLTGTISSESIPVDVSKLASGMYLIKVEENVVNTDRLIIE